MKTQYMLLLAALVVGAAAQEFPFKNGPLDPSLHSNKIFFNIDSIEETSGVWTGVSQIGFSVVLTPEFRNASIPIDQICDRAHAGGLLYSIISRYPQSAIVTPSDEEGVLGSVFDLSPAYVREYPVVELADGLMRFDDGSCQVWRPYFDWEVGKTMYLRNRRFYIWEENGQNMLDGISFCVKGDVDHPYCAEENFIIDGEEKTGVVVDTVFFYECTAGPCLELPHTLPGFVKTQGWQPRE